jgi:hypothetical protein
MPEEWFVRVQEKEYGPVDLETLKEWKAEGRLLPGNPVRRRDEENWSTAAAIPDLFESEVSAPSPEEPYRRRTFNQIIAEAFQIYRRGFPQFCGLALLVSLPSLAFKLSLSFVNYREGEVITTTTRVASAVAVVALAAVLVAWPLFIGGLQFAAADLTAGRAIRLRDILRRATNFWPRLAKLCVVVYGSYVFWTVLPVFVIITLASAPSIISFLLALVALAFQVYMAGRLFINFMFWQQSATLGSREGAEALLESRELARSRKELPRLERPLYRGAIIASLWIAVLLVVSAAIELPFMLVRLHGVTSFETAYAMMQSMVNAPAPDGMTIATYVLSNLVHAALRPLLGIAFIILYFDAKAR